MDATEILSPEARAFVTDLDRRFGPRIRDLLAVREYRRAEIAETGRLDVLPETSDIRLGGWEVPPAPPGLIDRRVEITGPTDRKMAINALNSGANVWLADHEDASTPHWHNVVDGQVNLYEAVRGTIAYDTPEGREYRLTDGPRPTIVLRPRGLHLPERHLLVDERPASGALVDFGLYAFHNATELVNQGVGPYFYLPKLESYREAALWHDVFSHTEDALGLEHGTIRATVLIETIPAAFEMDEILFYLGEHATALNAGRWDYLFSIIKYFRDAGPPFVLPDRNAVTMTAPFMRAYARLLVATCHKRGAHAIGGMAAFIPNRRDPAVNDIAFAKVRDDKEREAADGFDGSWVAHPDLVPLCREIFDDALGEQPNQLDRRPAASEPLDLASAAAASLLDIASTPGEVTEAGLRNNVSVALQYLESWLRGTGAVAINNLMEDAATAEISRSQVWQWIRVGVWLEGDIPVTAELVRRIGDEELAAIGERLGAEAFEKSRFADARELFETVALADDFADFLTLPAYELID